MRRVSRAKQEKNKKISEKIEVLRREGKTADQAAGEAYGMYRSGRLGRHGKYRKARRSHR